MRVLHVVAETPLSFLQHLKDITYIERRPLRYENIWRTAPRTILLSYFRFCAERLQSLIRTLELSRLDEYSSLQKVASFATLVSTYEKGVWNTFPSEAALNQIHVRVSPHSRTFRDRQCYSTESNVPFHVSDPFAHILRPYRNLAPVVWIRP